MTTCFLNLQKQTYKSKISIALGSSYYEEVVNIYYLQRLPGLLGPRPVSLHLRRRCLRVHHLLHCAVCHRSLQREDHNDDNDTDNNDNDDDYNDNDDDYNGINC